MIQIAGLQLQSLIDYPGCLSAVVFTQGCNMNCFYCHNRPLVQRSETFHLDAEAVLTQLEGRVGFLDSVVLSGGEPTLQPGLRDFILQLKKMGYRVKLDTNGTHPLLLSGLIQEELLDYVAMDIKAPPEKYRDICGASVSIKAIRRSIDLLLEGRVDYEFRTTFVPQLTQDDIRQIAQWIPGARRYFLQQYRRPKEGPAFRDIRNAALPHSSAELLRLMEIVKVLIPTGKTRGA